MEGINRGTGGGTFLMTLFSIHNLKKHFTSGEKKLEVLKGIDLELAPGHMMAIMGASGSGKTTMLQICGTLAKPSSGELIFNGESLQDKSSQELARFRNRELGFIFQFHHLLPEFTTMENVMMPALIAGKTRAAVRKRAEKLLQQVELGERVHHRITHLSGGEQQRTALARALIMQPKLLLADEPTGNLDSRSGAIVFDLLHALCREQGLALIMVTHNSELAGRMDSLRTLKDGMFEQDNP